MDIVTGLLVGLVAGVMGFSGLTHLEAQLVGPQEELAAGRWLGVGAMDECLLPVVVADSLGISAEDSTDDTDF